LLKVGKEKGSLNKRKEFALKTDNYPAMLGSSKERTKIRC